MGQSGQINRCCPVCGAEKATDFLRKDTLRLVSCNQCEMVYATPVPAEMVSGKYYDEAGSYYLSPAKLESDYASVRFERELRRFRAHCVSGAVLDVGCSTGAFLFQLKSRYPGSYEVLGADASGPALDYAESRGIAVARGDFLEQGFAEGTFDAVTFWAVLEHLCEPAQFLDKAWSILKPEGVCMVLVPNLCSLAARILGSRYRYVYPQHLNYFSPAALERLVSSRFSVIERRSMHFNPVVIWQDWRSVGAEVSDDARARLLKKTTGYKQNPWLKPAKALYSLAERALGRAMLADNLFLALRKRG